MGRSVFKKRKPPCPGIVKAGKRFGCKCWGICPDSQRMFLVLLMGIGVGCECKEG